MLMSIKKQLLGIFLIFMLVCSMMPGVLAAEEEVEGWKSFYVSPDGSDDADGTEDFPFKTIERAQEEVRKYSKDMQGDIVVNLMPGRYEYSGNERLEFHVEDSGSKGFDIIYRGTDSNSMPVISGAKEIKAQWNKDADGIYHAKIEGFDFVRELFINNVPAVRARSSKKVYGDDVYVGNAENAEGFYIDKTKMDIYDNPEDVELHWTQTWTDALFHVWDIRQDPDNTNRAIVIMNPDYWDDYMGFGLGTSSVHYKRGFIVENAYELLDEPGEFYYNKKTKILSYLPREGEDILTAEVLCPQNDQILMVSGDNDYNRVHNIRFENIKFAHATNLVLESADYTGGQAEYAYPSELHHRMGRAANLVEWADNIDFESCVFYGLTTIGLHFRDGVYNSEVVGNVFSDLGATGFAAGNIWDVREEAPKNTSGAANVAFQAGWSASSKWFPASVELFHALNTQSGSDDDLTSVGRGWYSREREMTEGSKPWLMLDLEKAYTLETIKLSFPEDSTDEQRSNFDVYVSNDRSFKDAKLIKSYQNAADFKEEITVGDGIKYRYIKLCKTQIEPFALNGIWAMSNDRAPHGRKGAPADCNISNNYFTRVGQTLWSSLGIWVNWTKNFDITHNVITDVPYSGMSIGWGWDQYANVSTVGNNNISHNRIDGFMRQASDGGGIYIFGKQYDSKLTGNYITDGLVNSVGIYMDNGCTGVTAADNICVETNVVATINSSTRDNKIYNMWSGGGWYNVFTSETYHTDDIKEFVYTNQPEEVTRIIASAGLEDKWSWIANRVPNVKSLIISGPDAYESFILKKDSGLAMREVAAESSLDSASVLLEKGEFGYLPWQYAPEAKAEVEYWVSALKSSKNRVVDYTYHLEDTFYLKTALQKAYDSVEHLSYEKMLTMCDDAAKDSTYPQDALSKFIKEYTAVKNTNPITEADKAVAAVRLEKIYTELYGKGSTAEILAVSVEGGTANVDRDNKSITLTLANGVNPKDILPAITTTADAKVATELNSLRYEKGRVVIPIYSKSERKYDFWTMDIISGAMSGISDKLNMELNSWTDGNINAKPSRLGEGILISPWFQPTMNKKPVGSTINFDINVPRMDTQSGIGIVFCAQSPNLLYDVREIQNSYYLAELKGQDLSLYKVVSGEKQLCSTVRSIGFVFGTYNPFTINITPEGNMDRIEIYSGNLLLIDTLVKEPIGKSGYFGILTRDMPVKLK